MKKIGRKYIHFFAVLAAFGFFECGLLGQSITASVSKNVVSTDQQFTFTILLKNIEGNIALPDLTEFDVLSGPNQSSRVQIINGKKEQTYQLSWILLGKKEGEFIIKPVEQEGGLSYDSVSIKVIQGTPRQQESNETEQGEIKDHFARIYVSNANPYQGEQIIATYVIYNRIRGFNPTYDFANTIEGFWTEELDIEPRWSDKYEKINGQNYQKAVVRKQILFPQKTGKLKIEPFTVQGRIRLGWGRVQNVDFKSNLAEIKVKALPPSAPDNFKGAVGAYYFEFEIDKKEVETDEAFAVKVKISGKGNLSMINELPVNFPSDFEVYDPEIKDNIGKTAAGMAGSRTYEYLVIPRHPGNYEIDGIAFSYFSPDAKKYVTNASEDLVISVKKDPNQINESGPTVVRKEDVTIRENDIRYISNSADLEPKGSFFFGSATYASGLITPVLAFLGFMLIRRRKQNELSDVIGTKKKKAGKVAAKRLAAARASLSANNTSLFYEELHLALSKYLNEKINLENADFTKESVQVQLEQRNVPSATISDLIEVLKNCEMAKYAPQTSADPNEMLAKGEEIINVLEREIA
ncbi:MAG: BatD family protein [Bacteroidota bacterium]